MKEIAKLNNNILFFEQSYCKIEFLVDRLNYSPLKVLQQYGLYWTFHYRWSPH